MQAKILLCTSIILICFGQWAVAGEISVRSVHSDQTGGVSIVVDVPTGIQTTASQFRLVEDNKITATATSLKYFKDSDWKLAIVLCIDKSGSIKNKQLERTKNALKELLRATLFKQQDRIALVSFENEPRLIQWFAGKEEILKKIDELEYLKGQSTVLYDALSDSLRHFDSLDVSPPELRRILVISDGEDIGSLKSEKEVREKALATGIAIDVVLVDAKAGKDPHAVLQKKHVKKMRWLAYDTGGKFELTEPGVIDASINKIFQDIMTAHVVYFERKVKSTSLKTSSVGVQLQLPDKQPVTDSIQAEILLSRLTEKSPWYWWIFVVLLVAILIAFTVWRSRRKTQLKPEKVLPTPAPLTPTPTPTPTPPQAQRRDTLVGGDYFPIPESNKPIAILICLGGPLEGKQFSMEKETFHIGANLENDLCIAEDEYVSGDHAYLRYEDGSLILFDNGSSNGTFVKDNTKVTDAGFVIKPGEHISIGTSVFEVAAPPG